MTTRDRSTKAKVDAYSAGKRAWQEQLPLASNPYGPEQRDERLKWMSGWKAARADSLQDADMQGSS
jgi:ribosome modulation factor